MISEAATLKSESMKFRADIDACAGVTPGRKQSFRILIDFRDS